MFLPRRPLLRALSRVTVADCNKPHLLADGDTRVLDACAAVLTWGTPGGPVDGGGNVASAFAATSQTTPTA